MARYGQASALPARRGGGFADGCLRGVLTTAFREEFRPLLYNSLRLSRARWNTPARRPIRTQGSATAQPDPLSGDWGFDLDREERLDRSVAWQRATLRVGCVGGGIADRRPRRIQLCGNDATPGGIRVP